LSEKGPGASTPKEMTFFYTATLSMGTAWFIAIAERCFVRDVNPTKREKVFDGGIDMGRKA
jgi:hypothetical protein